MIKIIGIVLGSGLLIFIVVMQVIELSERRKGKELMKVMEGLYRLEGYIETCPISEFTYNTILNRLKWERARPEMEEKIFCNRLQIITTIFEERFKKFIDERKN